ncbi:MAG: polysaccharide deacetylase family protein [Phycisphaerales bacterium]
MSELDYATSWRQAALRPVGAADRMRRFARDATLSVLAATRRSWEPRFLRGLYCHYVFDDQREAFERLLVSLRSAATFVDTDTCIDMLAGRKPVDGRYLHLSFDDGFRNNFTNALPVLRKHRVPAIFFVPSAVIGADRAAANAYSRRIEYRAAIETMTWDDLATMRDEGYEIGSHTRTHARFSEASADRATLESEIAGSKRDLEARLGIECKYISWPYGKRSDADAVSLQMARDAGYRACFGAYRGTMTPGVTDLFSIPRHHFEVEWPMAHVKYFARGNMEQPMRGVSA